ncbi:phage tail assembly protein [Roseibium album]|uniref:phage tail assembly protein n=1 Tax=Roseibium album TaxID=311410 RepID=UPI00391DED07
MNTKTQTPQAPEASDGSVITITLKRPLTNQAGTVLTSLVFREPEVGDAIDAEEAGGGEAKKTALVLSAMCGLDYADFRRIAASDFNLILDATADWLGN